MATLIPKASSESADWQTSKGTVLERTAFLFNNTHMSDITFVVLAGSDGTQVRVPAHKLVLAMGSPVFEAMFYGGLAEKRREIELPDTELPYLLEFLRFLYCDEVNLTTDNTFGVQYLAQKYIVPPLADKCWEFIDEYTFACLKSDNAVSLLNQDMLASIAKRDTLQNNELELFEAMKIWAKKRCAAASEEPSGKATRKALGDVINLVRWSAISVRDFAQHVVPTGILTDKESLDVYEYMSGAPRGRKRKYCEICRAGTFSDAELHECCREVLLFSESSLSDIEELVQDLDLVVENRNVYLKGIQLMTRVWRVKNGEAITADVRLLSEDGDELAASTGDFEEALIQGIHDCEDDEGDTNVISVEFKNPVLIWKGLKHTLVVKIRCAAGKRVPKHDTIFSDSVSAKNVSFSFEGSCPVYKLWFYKLD